MRPVPLLISTCVMTMAAMVSVHEQMHQGADQDQEERQGAKDVRPVLDEQKERRNRTQNHQADAIACAPQVLGFVRLGGVQGVSYRPFVRRLCAHVAVEVP